MMTKKVEVFKKLYDTNKINNEGLLKAVSDGVITQEEYEWVISTEHITYS